MLPHPPGSGNSDIMGLLEVVDQACPAHGAFMTSFVVV